MRKTVLLLTIISVALCGMLWVAALAAQEEMCVPMGEITLEPLTAEAKRSAVTFPHSVHFNNSCQRCHHTWNGQAPIVGCSTSGCHDLAELPKTDAGKPDPELKTRYFKNAYHDMCIGCHKEIKQKNKALEASMTVLGEKLPPTGPTGCIECHPEE